MKQSILNQVQDKITRLNEINVQVETLRKQLSEKESEISQFFKDWKNNCTHVFFRVQSAIVTTKTIGYCCYLCGQFEKLETNEQHPRNTINDETLFPIPAEYQAEVNSKKAHFDKLMAEKESLALSLEKLEDAVKANKEELSEIAHALNSYLGIPKTVYVYRVPRHPNDVYYD